MENKTMSLTVLIDNPKESYSPDDSIIGRLQCSVTVSDYIEVYIKLVGEESTHFVIKTTLRSFNRGQKAYFLESNYSIAQSGHLNEGKLEFPFKLTLPMGIPSSFVGKYGQVRYYLKGCIHRQGHEKYEDVKEFQVFSPIDLNKMQNVSMTSIVYSDEPDETSWLCAFQKPRMQILLDQTAYVRNDIITPTVVLRKWGDFLQVQVRLVIKINTKMWAQKEEYTSVRKLLALDEEKPVQRAYMFVLQIPHDVNIPNFDRCFLFSQTAVLEITAVYRDPSKPDLKVDVELILGHIPIDQQKTTRKPKDKSALHSRLPTDNHKSKTSNLPTSMPSACPSYPTKVGSPFVCQDILPNKIPKLPESLTNDNHPSQKQGLPDPKEDNFLNLKETSKIPPYPCDNRFSYPVKNNSPYPTEKSYANQDQPISIPYPTQIGGSIQSNNIPYPSENKQKYNTPYPAESSFYSTESKLTYPLPLNIPPYPKENAKNTPCPPKANTLPYPNDNTCPYPIAESVKIAPYPTTDNPPYPRINQKVPPPYPVCQITTTSLSSVSHSISRSSDSTPVNYGSFPSSTVGSTTPYPTETSSGQSALGFEIAMPMPMLPVRNDVGFGVLISDENFSQTQFQPSAPPVSEFTTPASATIEELDYIDSEDDSTPRDILLNTHFTDVIPSVASPTYQETISSIKEEKKTKKKSKRKELVAS